MLGISTANYLHNGLFSVTDIVKKRAMRRACKLARTALNARWYVLTLAPFPIFHVTCGGNQIWLKSHRTDVYALSTADTWLNFLPSRIVLGENGYAIRTFADWYIGGD